MAEAYIIDAARTAVGKRGGGLTGVSTTGFTAVGDEYDCVDLARRRSFEIVRRLFQRLPEIPGGDGVYEEFLRVRKEEDDE